MGAGQGRSWSTIDPCHSGSFNFQLKSGVTHVASMLGTVTLANLQGV